MRDRLRYKKADRGFTLIELIIVVAILAILVGLLAPQYTKYMAKAKRTACASDIDAITREYELQAMEESPADAAEASAMLETIMKDSGAEVVADSGGLYNKGEYSGICRSKGVYSCIFSANFAYLSIECSEHQGLMIDVETLAERLAQIDFSDTSFAYKTLDAYFAAGKTNIDSEAVGTGGEAAYGTYGSLAKAIEAKLKAQGLNLDNRSWRLYKKGNTYNLFLTERKITKEDINKGEIVCQKFDILNNRTYYGKVKVVKAPGFDFPIINGESFKEEK